jgi:signal transduction histidine kinase
LGLALARSRVQRAGGDLLIDTEPNVGTSVKIFLPIYHAMAGVSPVDYVS